MPPTLGIVDVELSFAKFNGSISAETISSHVDYIALVNSPAILCNNSCKLT